MGCGRQEIDQRIMSKVFIIAEAGVNHNGEWEIARKLVDAAVEAGADEIGRAHV